MSAPDGILVVTADSVPGLTAVRSLGRNGLRVYGAYRPGMGLGTYSRYCRGALRLPIARDEALDGIERYCRIHGISHIMAIEERDIPFLNWARSTLEPEIIVLCPTQEAFSLVLHKERTLALARELGIPAPRTVYPACAGDLSECSALRFPVVLKPKHRDTKDGWHPIFNLKCELVENLQDLAQKLELYERNGQLPMVQEFAPGYGVGVSVLMHHQSVQQVFQHKRVREFGGAGVYCESVALDPKMVEQSVALLKAMEWEGVAMVEYRFDPETGSSFLMEVNGRFWGSLPLACSAGADFPYLLYCSRSRKLSPTPYKVGLKARDLPGDTRWLLAALRSSNGGRLDALIAYVRAFGFGVRYYIWSLADPLPAAMQLMLGLVRRLPTWLRRPETPHYYERL